MPATNPRETQLRALTRENDRLRRAVEELSFLNEMATSIGAARDLGQIMQTIVRRSLRAVGAAQGDITLVGVDEADPTQTLIRTRASSGDHDVLRPAQSLLGWMHLNRAPLLINDPRRDARFRGTRWHPAIRSILSVPLVVQGRLIGVLTLYNKKDPAGFTPGDQRLMAILAQQSAQVIETARLLEEEERLHRIQKEQQVAGSIQRFLLPRDPPPIPGYDVAGTSRPARTVGGDYYDVIPVDDGRFLLCLGDVSGKGMPAALLMANLQALLRGQGPRFAGDVTGCIASVNRLLYESTPPSAFITLFYGLLDCHTHRFDYVNAGHNLPFFLPAGGPARTLPRGGLVLGVRPDFVYEAASLTFGPGDVLCIYSDGISEAMNPDREQFGEERIPALLGNRPGASSADRIEALLDAVHRHAGSAEQADDMTLLLARRLP